MIFNQHVPRINNVRWLARLAMPFPTTAGEIAEIAAAWRFDQGTLEFLARFPADEKFNSKDDFLTRCDELDLLLREEMQAPAEPVLSPQD